MSTKLRRFSLAFLLFGSSILFATAFFNQLSAPHWFTSSSEFRSTRFKLRGGHPRINPLQPRHSPQQNFVFDPVLIYSTFLGGDSLGYLSNPTVRFDQGVAAISVDSSGNLLVGGATTATDFPVTPGVVQPNNSHNNSVGFLSKISPAGQLVFSTYLDGMETVASIAVDASGNIYVAGVSLPSDVAQTPLPIPSGTNPFNPTPKPISIVKLNSTATAILNATYLGGSGADDVSGLALDPTGNVYVAGYTTSNDFPTMNPLQSSLGARGRNVFVTKLKPDLGSLTYSTYLGQNNSVVGAGVATPTGTANHGIAVDASSNAYVILAGAAGGCLAKLNAAGSSVLYPNFSCGANAVAVDGSQNVYAVGVTTGAVSGSLAPCPQPPPIPEPPTWEGAGGFVSEFNAAGTLTFSTCLGLLVSANGGPRANGGVNDLVLDASGNIYVVGNADSGIPLTNPIQGMTPMFVAAIDPKTPALLFASGIGAGVSSTNIPTSVAVDSNGNIYAAGLVANPPSFPVFNALQPVPGMLAPGSVFACGNCTISDGFVLGIAPTDAAAAALAPAQLVFPVLPVGSGATQTVTIFDMGSTPLTVSNATVTGDFSIFSNHCGSVAAAGGTCTIQVSFTPTAAGTRHGTLTITDTSAGSPRNVQLIGEGGQGAASLSPTSLSFNSQQIGATSAAQTVTLTNSGALALQVSHIQASTLFNETNTCGASVPAAGSCMISITFTPTAAAAATGTLTITDSAPDSPQTVALTGAGVAPGPPPSIGLGLASGGSASATVAAGASATYALSIGGAGLSGTASLTCTGAPAGANCTVPSTAQVSAATVSTFNLTVSTTSRGLGLFDPRVFGPGQWLWVFGIVGCLVLVMAARAEQVRCLRLRWVPLLAVVLCACGGGGSMTPTPNLSGTQPGTYMLTVTAKSGSTTQTQNLTLTVR